MKRNTCIELIKLALACCIAVGDFSRQLLPSGSVTMLFFILSGYFLVGSFISGKYSDPWRFSLGRIKRIYPHYFAAFVVLFLYVGIHNGLNLFGLGASFLTSTPELLMIHGIGVFPGGLNYPLWQLSALIVASHILYALLQWNKSMTVNVICPLLALTVFTYLSGGNGYVVPNQWGVELNFIYIPLLRAFGGVAMGMFLHDPVKRMLKHLENSSLKIMPVLVSASVVVLLAMFWFTRASYAIVLPFAGLLIWSFYSKGLPALLSRIPLGRLDKLSLGIYLNHALVGHVILDNWHLFPGVKPPWGTAVYMAVVIVFSLIMILMVEGLMKLIKKLFVKRQPVEA